MANKSTSSYYDFKYCKKCKIKTGHTIRKIHFFTSGKVKVQSYCKRCGYRYHYFKRN